MAGRVPLGQAWVSAGSNCPRSSCAVALTALFQLVGVIIRFAVKWAPTTPAERFHRSRATPLRAGPWSERCGAVGGAQAGGGVVVLLGDAQVVVAAGGPGAGERVVVAGGDVEQCARVGVGVARGGGAGGCCHAGSPRRPPGAGGWSRPPHATAPPFRPTLL